MKNANKFANFMNKMTKEIPSFEQKNILRKLSIHLSKPFYHCRIILRKILKYPLKNKFINPPIFKNIPHIFFLIITKITASVLVFSIHLFNSFPKRNLHKTLKSNLNIQPIPIQMLPSPLHKRWTSITRVCTNISNGTEIEKNK